MRAMPECSVPDTARSAERDRPAAQPRQRGASATGRLGALAPWPVVCTVLFVAAATCLAQDDAVATTADSTTSLFEQFFWSGTLLGRALIWLLLLMSFASIAFALKLFIDSRRAVLVPAEVVSRVRELLDEKQYRSAVEHVKEDDSYLGRIIAAALGEAASGYNAMARAIEEAGDYETSRMLRPVEYLNVVGNIAPMLGLFGTVYGMIVAFEALVASGGKPDPATLAGGIGTALVTTFWGLIVAMPALAAYALVRNKIDALTAEGITIAADLIKPFKPTPRRAVPVDNGAR